VIAEQRLGARGADVDAEKIGHEISDFLLLISDLGMADEGRHVNPNRAQVGSDRPRACAHLSSIRNQQSEITTVRSIEREP
jgi:hypothetical protein